MNFGKNFPCDLFGYDYYQFENLNVKITVNNTDKNTAQNVHKQPRCYKERPVTVFKNSFNNCYFLSGPGSAHIIKS